MSALAAISERILLSTDRQKVTSLEIPQGAFFQPMIDEGTENTVVIMQGEGRIQVGNEMKTVTPISLYRADKMEKIFNDQIEPLKLYWIQAKGTTTDAVSPFYVRRKEECFEIKATEEERIYELYGEKNGEAQRHSVAVVDLHPGGSSDEHYHPVVEEIYLVNQGTGNLILDSQEMLVEKGSAIQIPVGKKHQIFNTGDQTLQLVVVCVPYWTLGCGIYTKKPVE